jgi:hypothetical protein
VPWAGRVWALPFLSVLAPSERYSAQRGKRHKKITDWAWQMLLLVRRWWPERQIVAVADSTYASLKLLDRCRSLSKPVTFITRLRLDAALYEPAPLRRLGQMGRPRLKGERLPNLSVVAEDSSTAWRSIAVADWYGKAERTLETTSATAVWYSTGLPAVPIRWVHWCAIHKGSSPHRIACCAPSLVPNPSRSLGGLPCVGRWRRPFRKRVGIWVCRRKGSGRSWRYGEPHRRS